MKNTQNRPKILILSDGQGWIVDRITDEMIKRMPLEFVRDSYTTIDPEKFVEEANKCDMVHIQNWDVRRLMHTFDRVKVPILMSVRSFRYPTYVYDAQVDYIHVINPDLKDYFPTATYIADGIFDQFKPDHDFVVGMAIQNTEWSKTYKGFYLVEQACKELGIKFKPALNLKPEEMPDYYRAIDLLVCASTNEGFGTPVMECMAINKPVLTTNVGIMKYLDIDKVEKHVESIKKGILRHCTYLQVQNFRYDIICDAFTQYYLQIIEGGKYDSA